MASHSIRGSTIVAVLTMGLFIFMFASFRRPQEVYEQQPRDATLVVLDSQMQQDVALFPPTEPAELMVPSVYAEKEVFNVVYHPRMFDVSTFQSTMMMLLKEIRRPIRYVVWPDLKQTPKDQWPVISNALFFPFGNKMMEIKADEYFEYARSKGAKNLGVLHLSDEVCASAVEFYHLVDFVIRRYYCPRAFREFPNTLWFPNGWADGVGPKDPATLLLSSVRGMNCFFKGRKTSHRAEFVETMEKLNADCVMDFSEGYGKGDARPAYSASLGNAKFAPCPAGNSPETIRFYDSLENGAIPVVLESKFTKYMLTYEKAAKNEVLPFLVLQSWEEYNDAVRPYLEDADKLNQLQARTISFWNRMKQRAQDGVRQLVEQGFKNAAAAA